MKSRVMLVLALVALSTSVAACHDSEAERAQAETKAAMARLKTENDRRLQEIKERHNRPSDEKPKDTIFDLPAADGVKK